MVSGLDSQEHRCREYAQQRGYQVDAIFPDDVSGGGDFMKRPGMVALLSYLDARPDDSYVVIFDDLKRYARDTEFHLKLKREMSARGATRECLNFKFEDTPEGKFIETVLAAQGQLEREQNGRQVRQKMQARMCDVSYDTCAGLIVARQLTQSENNILEIVDFIGAAKAFEMLPHTLNQMGTGEENINARLICNEEALPETWKPGTSYCTSVDPNIRFSLHGDYYAISTDSPRPLLICRGDGDYDRIRN